MKNKVLRCQDCYNRFVFTEKQQLFYSSQGWDAPIRCPLCRARKKEIQQINHGYWTYIKSCNNEDTPSDN